MLKALFLNCTLKSSGNASNTQALINKAISLFEDQDVCCESIRIADYQIKRGVRSDEGQDDEWPTILHKIKSSNILVIGSPIWFGVRSSLAQLVFERLDATYAEARKANGQYPLYNKVAGVLVTGNEDGAHNVSAHTLFNLSHLGCTIPPNADSYWVGDAGPGPSYIEAGVEKHLYTNKTLRFMANNLIFFSKILADTPSIHLSAPT